MLCFICNGQPYRDYGLIPLGAEVCAKCRIDECNKIGVPDMLGLCATHYDEYEQVKQEIIQDDYYL
jgi:hypothetical protein